MMEMGALQGLVQAQLESGKNEDTLEWATIAQALSQLFNGVTQKAGDFLAQTNIHVNGEGVVPPKKKLPQLKLDRVGPVIRSATVVRNQARKYPSTRKLLDEHSGTSNSAKRGRESDIDREGTGEDEAGSSGSTATPSKKRKIEDKMEKENAEGSTEKDTKRES